MSTRHVIVAVAPLALGIVVGSSVLVGGQPAKPAQPQWYSINISKIVPGAAAEYTQIQTAEVMPAQKKGGSGGRQAWASGVAGVSREIVYISPIASFDQYDKPAPLVTALGQEGAAAVNARLAKLAEPQRSMIVRTRPDLSYLPDPKNEPALAMVSFVDVVPGRKTDFEAFIKKDVLPAMEKARAKSYSVMEVVYGDSINTFITAIGYDTYADVGKGHPFVIALGEDGAKKLDARITGIASRVERSIYRHRSDLSWSPTPGSN
jgi:hypothetical protein